MHDVDRAVAAFGRALAIADEHGLEVWRVRALFELGTIDVFKELSGARLTSARERALADGALGIAAHTDLLGAFCHLDRFELDEASASARWAGEVARRFRMQRWSARAAAGRGDSGLAGSARGDGSSRAGGPGPRG